MDNTSDHLKSLVSVPTELEASVIVSLLEDHGIKAKAVGGYTSGFKAILFGTEFAIRVAPSEFTRWRDDSSLKAPSRETRPLRALLGGVHDSSLNRSEGRASIWFVITGGIRIVSGGFASSGGRRRSRRRNPGANDFALTASRISNCLSTRRLERFCSKNSIHNVERSNNAPCRWH